MTRQKKSNPELPKEPPKTNPTLCPNEPSYLANSESSTLPSYSATNRLTVTLLYLATTTCDPSHLAILKVNLPTRSDPSYLANSVPNSKKVLQTNLHETEYLARSMSPMILPNNLSAELSMNLSNLCMNDANEYMGKKRRRNMKRRKGKNEQYEKTKHLKQNTIIKLLTFTFSIIQLYLMNSKFTINLHTTHTLYLKYLKQITEVKTEKKIEKRRKRRNYIKLFTPTFTKINLPKLLFNSIIQLFTPPIKLQFKIYTRNEDYLQNLFILQLKFFRENHNEFLLPQTLNKNKLNFKILKPSRFELILTPTSSLIWSCLDLARKRTKLTRKLAKTNTQTSCHRHREIREIDRQIVTPQITKNQPLYELGLRPRFDPQHCPYATNIHLSGELRSRNKLLRLNHSNSRRSPYTGQYLFILSISQVTLAVRTKARHLTPTTSKASPSFSTAAAPAPAGTPRSSSGKRSASSASFQLRSP